MPDAEKDRDAESGGEDRKNMRGKVLKYLKWSLLVLAGWLVLRSPLFQALKFVTVSGPGRSWSTKDLIGYISSDAGYKWMAVKPLVERGGDEVVLPMLEILEKRESMALHSAIMVFEGLLDERAREPLFAVMSDGNVAPHLRNYAASALMAYGDRRGADHLVAEMRKGSGDFNLEPHFQVPGGQRKLELLIRLLEDPDELTRLEAAKGLERYKDKKFTSADIKSKAALLRKQDAAAQKYYDDGILYKEQGLVERSRAALAKAVELSPGTVGIRAARFMRTKLPAAGVPCAAITRNIDGYNRMTACDLAGAAAVFEGCISDYPGFEWPYNNLAMIYIHRQSYSKADELLKKALAINSCYVNAWVHLAESRSRAGDAAGRAEAVAAALKCDPEDVTARRMRAYPGEKLPASYFRVARCR